MPRVSRRRLALAFLSPIVALLLAEAALRLGGWGGSRARYYDPLVRNQAFGPDQTHMMVFASQPMAEATINRAGFRGPWPDGPPVSERPRVLCLGDSFTFGWSVADEETYPAQLTDLLGDRAEVLNAGIPNYNSENELLLYRHRLRDLEPDVVVIGVVTNDLEPTPGIEVMGGALGRFVHGTALFDLWVERFGSEHALLRAVDGGVRDESMALFLEHQVAVVEDPAAGVGPRLVEPWRASFEALLAELRADDIEVLVVVFPARFQIRRAERVLARGEDPTRVLSRSTGWQLLLRSVCERAEVACLDLLLPFVHAGEDTYHPVDRSHPSREGYRATAEGVAEELRRLGWVR